MKGKTVILALKKKLRTHTDRALANKLGLSVHAIHNWKKRERITERQVSGLVNSANKAGAAGLGATAIRPLVEFYPISKCKSKQGANFELFALDEDGKKHPHREGLREELTRHHGVYVFFDSRGQAIYAGKARRQSLWREMKLAFNRERGEIQKIKRVKQPTRMQKYRDSNEKTRQIREFVVPLYELATYFSAYVVADNLINDVESMLVRSFANDLLNMRMERFGQQKRSRAQ